MELYKCLGIELDNLTKEERWDRKDELVQLVVWPDGGWEYLDDFEWEVTHPHRSDDYGLVFLTQAECDRLR